MEKVPTRARGVARERSSESNCSLALLDPLVAYVTRRAIGKLSAQTETRVRRWTTALANIVEEAPLPLFMKCTQSLSRLRRPMNVSPVSCLP